MTTRVTVSAALVAGVLLLTACGGDAGTATAPPSVTATTSTPSTASTSATFPVVGRVVLIGPYSAARAGDATAACDGTGGFADLRVGARITVTDASDTTVGVGAVDRAVAGGQAGTDLRTCEFSFAVDDVPRGSASYRVKVAMRDSPTFTADELARPVVLTLGNT